MKRVLLTGGTGMVGANLVRRLVADGFQVSLLTRPESRRDRLDGVEGDLEFLDAALTDAAAVQRAVDRAAPRIVFHLASTPFNPPTFSPEQHLSVIVMGTLHLLEAVRRAPETVVVFTGSAAAYGSGSRLSEDQMMKPATVLGACKAAAAILLQTYARLHGMRTVELRLFMPYGPWEHPGRLIPQAILAALDGKDIPMSLGKQQRDLVYIEDVVDGLIKAGTSPLEPGSVFNIASGVGTPIKDVVGLILKLTGGSARALLGALPARSDEIMEMSGDISKANAQLNWQPKTTLEQGLRKTIAWIGDNRAKSSFSVGSVPCER